MKNVRHRKISGIPVLEVVPEALQNDALPLVIYYHGWQTSKELVLTQARKLAKQNIRVLLPDAMNHGERKYEAVSKIPAVTFWSSIQYNIIEFNLLLAFFNKKGLILNQKIGVGGLSMGGMTTCALLTQHPEITAAVCLMGTPKPIHYIERIIRITTERKLAIPKDLAKLLSWVTEYDLSFHPESLAGRPVLFWHGTQDPKVPYEDTASFYQAVKDTAYGKQVQFLTSEGTGHLVSTELMDTVTEFLVDQLTEKDH